MSSQSYGLKLQGLVIILSLDVPEGNQAMDYFPNGSPESVCSVISFCKTLLGRPDSSLVRPLVYKYIEDFLPDAFKYRGGIRLKSVQLALDGITLLRQDANMPQNVQRIFDDLESLYKSEAYSMETKSHEVDDVAMGCCRRPATMAWRFLSSLVDLGLFLILVRHLWILLFR
ncbi:hypothetical protein V493_00466 [Pseudogymnoascus sp. VKM F-4281 (FW-2241)]|nr:hypothetical protein V493_00466 [Pseudogymnoascus sp. VKM F-4281 (FW-2241)]